MDIGSNKPTREEQALVPHHLVDIRNPKDPMNAGDFVQAATPIIFDILSRNKVPIIVGGSTMWLLKRWASGLWALIFGLGLWSLVFGL